MDEYSVNKLEAASELLQLLGVPYPHTFQEKVQAIRASEAASQGANKGKLKATLHNYYSFMKQTANKISEDRLKQEYNSLKGYPMKICVADWRDDSGQLFWV